MSRSDHYQWKLKEILFCPYVLGELIEERGADETDPELMDRREEFARLLLTRIPSYLTEHQAQVFELVMIQGKTQVEAAKIIGCNQSSITKALKGNMDYRDPRGMKRFGGMFRRVRKMMVKDLEVMELAGELGLALPSEESSFLPRPKKEAREATAKKPVGRPRGSLLRASRAEGAEMGWREQRWAAIRAAVASGELRADVARQFGVSPGLVSTLCGPIPGRKPRARK